MDEETKEKIFSSLFSTKGERGTGLGLLVTEKIIKENGGKINVASEPGNGTTFTIYLPYQEVAKAVGSRQ
ncbi:MAG: histidine kinase, partial [Proteobacteria bacterium]|nr:histidine kinase [Pseudomonadota bacterium]